MALKYSRLRNKIPAFKQESTFQQRIDEWKKGALGDEPDFGSATFLASLFAKYKAQKEEHEEKISEINVALEAISQVLIEKMQADDIEKFSTSFGTIGIQYSVYPSVENQEQFMAWIKKQRLQGILSVNAKRLQGIVGELLSEGKPAPLGVKVFLKSAARIYKNGDTE